MIIKDGVVYRNLQEQVCKNQRDIADLQKAKSEVAGYEQPIEGAPDLKAIIIDDMAYNIPEGGGSGSYEAGTGITIDHNTISIDQQVVPTIEEIMAIPGYGLKWEQGKENLPLLEVDTTEIATQAELAEKSVVEANPTGTDLPSLTTIAINGTSYVVEGTAGEYSGGYGIVIAGNEISIDQTVVAEQSDIQEERQTRQQADLELQEAVDGKQDALSTSTGIHLMDNILSVDTGVIATRQYVDDTATALENLKQDKFNIDTTLKFTPESDTDTLGVDTNVIQPKLSAGNLITIGANNVIAVSSSPTFDSVYTNGNLTAGGNVVANNGNVQTTSVNASGAVSCSNLNVGALGAIVSGNMQCDGNIIGGLSYLTTAPTSANTHGIKFVYLASEPSTKYSGYVYLIAE